MSIFPENVSTYGEAIDSLASLITVLVAIGFFASLGLLLYTVVAFRRSSDRKASYIVGERWGQVKWVIVPVVVILVLDLFIDLRTHSAWAKIKQYLPQPDVAVRVTGQQFSWVFTYPDAQGNLDSDQTFQAIGDLHVPVGKNIVFDLEAKDVVHSFWVPALRLKQDAVPGRTIKGWFNATKIGEYDIGCAQICGGGHTNMHARLIVESQDDFNRWMAAKGKLGGAAAGAGAGDPVARGQELLKVKACTACHSIDGTKLVGPSYKGLFMKTETVVSDGREHDVVVDEAYLRKSIKEPMADIVKGYTPSMPQLNLSDDEISDVIEYIKTLK